MKRLGKITRIILKTLLFSILSMLVLLIVLFFAAQTESFQTWAAQKATKYLSKELDVKVKDLVLPTCAVPCWLPC